MKRRWASLGLAALLLVSAPAAAQLSADETRNAARDLAGQGKSAFERGDFEKARDLFHRAYTLVPVPSIAIFEARSLASLGRLVEAEEAYLRTSRSKLPAGAPDAFRTAVAEADEELQKLRPRIPKLTVALTGGGAQHPELVVQIDGNDVPQALRGVEMPFDPGKHRLTAQAPGGELVQVQFELTEREREQVDVNVPAPAQQATGATPPPTTTEPNVLRRDQPAPAPRSSWQKPAAFVAGGIGVAGLATGIVTGLMASSKHSKATSSCPDNVCPPGSSGWDDVESFRTLRTVSTVGYVVGAVGLAGGVTLWLVAPSSSSRAVGARVTGDSLFVEGTF